MWVRVSEHLDRTFGLLTQNEVSILVDGTVNSDEEVNSQIPWMPSLQRLYAAYCENTRCGDLFILSSI